jgi:hypothetical protein
MDDLRTQIIYQARAAILLSDGEPYATARRVWEGLWALEDAGVGSYPADYDLLNSFAASLVGQARKF